MISIQMWCNILTLDRAVNQETAASGRRISPWPVDMVEFGADAYAHGKQVDIKQLYNQVPQTAWVSWSSRQWVAVGVPVGEKMPAWESACRLRAASPQWPPVEQPSRMRKKCCYGQRNLGSICSSLFPSPTHISHTTNINPFKNKVWEIFL